MVVRTTLRGTPYTRLLTLSIFANVVFSIWFLFGSRCETNSVAKTQSTSSNSPFFSFVSPKNPPKPKWSPSLFKTCCPQNQSVEMNAEYPSFSFCLHPRGKDYAVSDSVYKASGSSEGLFETPIRKQMLQVLERHGDPNAVVLDIGANIGLHAMFLANAGYKVHVFEPLKKNYDLLACSATSSARLYNNVVVNPYGLGKEVGKSCIVTDHDNFGAAKIKNGQTCTPEYTVEVRRLDEYLTKSKIQPTLIKIDTEGYEFKALITAKEIFKKNPPPHIFTEFVPRHFKDPAVNEDPEDYLQFFYDLGYKIQWRDVKEVKKGDANYKDLLNTDMNDLYMYR